MFLVSIYILGDLRKLQIYVIPEITFFHENETYSSSNHRTFRYNKLEKIELWYIIKANITI